MPLTRPDDWRPRGVDDLEPNAWRALRHGGCASVVAGPGAGKTEFLAQRASYLLETGICPAPRRILAISLKTDAASNLAERVRRRCGEQFGSRFDSMTFDAFTKGLVDRFGPGLPPAWRFDAQYGIMFPKDRDLREFLQGTIVAAPDAWRGEIAGYGVADFEARRIGALRLEAAPRPPASALEFAASRWWAGRVSGDGSSMFTFTMLNRLAEMLLRTQPQIGRAVRATYPFVFVDEFQDTTFSQFDFLHSVFRHPGITVTAVGDGKQRIMGWAGARTDTFERFRSDFGAIEVPLLCNFRSSPELVTVQHVVAQAVDAGAIQAVSRATRAVSGDVVQVWASTSEAREADYLASWIASDMASRGTAPRDYAILVRQTADRFEKSLRRPFAALGLGLRNEAKRLGRTMLQDLLGETMAVIALAILRLATERRAPDSWMVASKAIARLRAADPEDAEACAAAEKELVTFVARLRKSLRTNQPDTATAQALSAQVVGFLGQASLARAYPEYGSGDNLSIAVEGFGLHLAGCADGAPDWKTVLDRFEGLEQVPLLTVHKSKGLEYDTILFVGLDDRMWWSHSAGNPEGLSTFFVALSRARQRAIFTFCSGRGARTRVADLHALLASAGVPEITL